MSMRSTLAALTIMMALLASSIVNSASFAQTRSEPRIVLLSVDGLRRDLLDTFVARGDLPNIAKMTEQGSTGVLVGVYPTNAYASQASMATGVYPKTHGILGSEYHATGTPLGSRTPSVNSTSILAPAEPFWAIAEKAGLNATIANFPFSWPPQGNETVVNVADTSLAPSALYTTRQLLAGETGISLTDADRTLWGYELRDPRELVPREAQVTVEGSNETFFVLVVDSKLQGAYDAVYVSRSRNISDALALLTKNAAWTPPVQVTVRGHEGVFRLRLLEVSADGQNLTAYTTEIAAAKGFTQPNEISSALVNQTVFPLASPDWKALSQGWFGEDVYMETLEMAGDWYANSTVFCSTKTQWQVFAAYFPLVGEVQKAFLGYVTEGHPRYEAGRKEAYLDRVERAYIRLDAVVGSLLPQIDENTILILASPSGSTPVDRVFYVNRWLRDHGWLSLTADGQVDWNSTKMYYSGDGQMFVNLKGREANGIVERSDYTSLVAAVSGALVTASDQGKVPLALVASPASMRILGLGTERAGDIALIPTSGYTFSEALGGNETSPFESTPAYLTGELSLYPVHDGAEGFLAIAGAYVAKGRLSQASVVDVAPTLVAVLNMGPTNRYDGTPLSSVFTVKVGEATVLEQGRIVAANIQRVEEQLADLQRTVSAVKADAIVYPFVVGLLGVVIGLAVGSAIGKRRPQ